MTGLRVAILAHSTNPRGGVVHALELGDALARLGHKAVVHAPDTKAQGFFRATRCETIAIPAAAAGDLIELVAVRRAEYRAHFERGSNRDFDVFHAQDSISANALADLKTAGIVNGFARTVHHVDAFGDPELNALQERGIAMADRHFVVSRQWQRHLGDAFGLHAEIVGNGVDPQRFSARSDANDAELRARLRLSGGPVLLAVGGVEARKNSLRVLQAFGNFRQSHPQAQLVIAGGASLFDHSGYRHEFDTALAAAALPEAAVIVTGPLPQALMPALYRCADVLVFASLKEGFGLVVLEAMAAGIPVVTSNTEPFTEYLDEQDAAWCDPYDAGSIALAIHRALEPRVRLDLQRNGIAVAARHDWGRVAAAHLAAYRSLRAPQHA